VTSREEIEAILQPPMDSVESSVVYTNAIASIRVRRKWFMTEEGLGMEFVFKSITVFLNLNVSFFFLDPLDDTRVHPDDYGFARKMVADALESHDDEDHWQFLVLDLMEDPKKEKKLSEIGNALIDDHLVGYWFLKTWGNRSRHLCRGMGKIG